jgi:hypothetical protein
MANAELLFMRTFTYALMFLISVAGVLGAIAIVLVIILIVIEIYSRNYYKFKLNKIRKKKKEYSKVNIYSIIDQEFNRKIHRCIWQQNSLNDIEYIDRKEIKRIEIELHGSVKQKLLEIKEKISNQENTNIDINSIKLELVQVFRNILSIVILREYMFRKIRELSSRYRNFIILLIYTKMIADNQNLSKETQEAIELEKEEISIIETLNYFSEKNSDYNYNTSTFINTIEEFSELAKNIFRNFDELYSMCMPQQETREEPVNNTNKEPVEEPNKTEEQEIIDKYRVII